VLSVEPREAASVILLREGSPFEILMVARNPTGRVMAGVWVFPGGGVEAHDGGGVERLRRAAIRELAEETAITGLDASDLVPFSRWIAPISLPVRFDTHFFLARAPAGAEPAVDGVECVDVGWFTAAHMLAAAQGGTFPLLFPTRRHLERLRSFASVEAAFADAHGAAAGIEAIHPRLPTPGHSGDPLLPGDPGYDTATG
jgi:8-oxo-dGTP pyrophosphatase MutT (NUDIX family)